MTIVVDMSTMCRNFLVEKDDLKGMRALREFIVIVSRTPYIARREHLLERLDLLDKLDAIIGHLDSSDLTNSRDACVISLARTLSSRLEAANEDLYEAIRSEIVLHGSSSSLRHWLLHPAGYGDLGHPHFGLGFDLRDEILSGVLQLREPSRTELPRSLDMVPYQPTPVRHILDLAEGCCPSNDDVFIDLGSGLGHVPLLISLLLGIRTLGVERQPSYVSSAQECVRRLNLERVQFVAEDARLADLSGGTIFYLFSPFTGVILTDVLDRLRMESIKKQIKICSLGPCTHALAGQTWLSPNIVPDARRITVFASR